METKIFYNGPIYTLDQSYKVSAVVIQNGRIVEVGDENQLLQKYSERAVEKVNLDGGMMIPGLTDSHMHLIAHGLKLRSLDFSQCQSAQEVIELLKGKVEQTPAGEWVVGRGWNENNFVDRKVLTKDELDDISTKHPIFLTRICGHAFIANTPALQMASIDEQTPDPSGGKIVRDANNKLTGMLLDHAGYKVQEHIPSESYDELKQALQMAIKDCWRLGLVGCHTEDVRYSGGFTQTCQLFEEVIHKEGNPFRVQQLVYHEYIDEMLQQGKRFGDGDAFFHVGPIKIFTDGAMGGRSALLSEPYSDDESTSGVAIYSQEELDQIVGKAREHGFPIAVHTIGDLALEMTLNAIEKHPLQTSDRDRIIHAQVLRPELLERMKNLPLAIDIQPRFVAADFPWVIERLGIDRIRWSYAWRTLVHAGLHCAGGSDAPIEPVDPLLGIHAAVTRTRPEEKPHNGYLPEQKLTVKEAINLFTKGSAYAEQTVELKGTISLGKFADFTILKDDLFTTDPSQWLENEVLMTVVNGKIVYRK